MACFTFQWLNKSAREGIIHQMRHNVMCLIWCSSDEQSMLRSARSPLCLMTPTMRSVSNTLFLWLDYLQLFHTPVSAHALASGKAGNIPALAVDTVEGSSVYVRNVASFQDGRDAYSVKIVTFQDRQAALGKARQHWFTLPLFRNRQRSRYRSLALPIYYLPYTGIYACGRCDNSGKKSFISCLVRSASRPYLGEVNTRSFVYTVRSCFCPSPERNLPVSTSEKSTHPTITQRKRAVIYCRVSTDKQEQDGESLEYQEDKCRRYAELHDLDVVAVLKEAKSGFIHYSLRDKLTLARQLVRDGMADMIIVFDLRRFSRNFVHSAMIFEEIESNGAEIVSVSENIDNSLTGKLIRSILAWSAESERHKIVEYANRRWQTRVEVGLPVGTGRSPYGWDWQDKEKTGYVVNQEQAAVRVPIFHMFVELDMSLRAITHKLTEDRILMPTYAKKFQGTPPQDLEVSIVHCLWRYTTVREVLKDLENIGILVVCKAKQTIGQDGKRKTEVHPNRREVPGGIPAIIDSVLYERAQEKLKTNKADKSHLPLNNEDFLLRGHIYCATCTHTMKPRTQKKGRLTQKGTDKSYPFYACANTHNKYKACPSLTTIRTSPLDRKST